ncbi:dimethylarginine dimethylaminohydrolase family protein [Bacillus sinesaloumensis]|uniref:dimethylarginine dimethylaminohydrolase family protein n=1 Tax=Litchfieldia sinesaloumensis TaxID=1926280 RepID=UPI00098845DE|nr:arginine deiminase family protein [Bacillus sinesaloumensis]
MKEANQKHTRNLVQEPFHDYTLIKDVWRESWGVTNDVGKLTKVVMHRPGKEVLNLKQNPKDIESGPLLVKYIKGTQPEDLEKNQKVDLIVLQDQHDKLVKALEHEGIEVIYLEGNQEDLPERTFTRDLGMVIPSGVILSRLAIYIRYGETRLASQTFAKVGIPILGCIQGNGFVEGGSFTMLNEHTAIIGRSERVSPSGIEQLQYILSLQNIELITVDLPSTIIHLDEAFLLIDRDKALINKALLPYWFIDELHKRKIELFHVHPEDPPLTINVLPVSPGRLIFPSSGVKTMELLKANGIEIIPVDISEFYKLGGGIHCLTLPLTREPV